MQNKEIKPGDKFGRLTFVKEAASFVYTYPTTGYSVRIRRGQFSCSCGKTVIARYSSILGGSSKSCGCIVTEKNHKRFLEKRKLYIGKTFGTRKVLSFEVGKRRDGKTTGFYNTECLACGKKQKYHSGPFVYNVALGKGAGYRKCKCQVKLKDSKYKEPSEHFFVRKWYCLRAEGLVTDSYDVFKDKHFKTWLTIYPNRVWFIDGKFTPLPKYSYIIDGKTYTRAELVKMLGLTRERIRQLHNSGLLEQRVKDYLDV
jgi:hypothetical protein